VVSGLKDEIITEFKNNAIDNYTFYNAIDGKKLCENLKITRLFKDNDFGNKKGVIGCALSHIDLWTKLLESNNDYYIIVEDDIKLTKDFKQKNDIILNFVKNNKDKFDFLITGFHMFSEHKEKYFDKYFKESNEINILNLDRSIFIGGTFSYIVTRRGSENMLKYIRKNGVKHGIDYLFKINEELEILETSPHIILSDWVTTTNFQVDSDIQKDFDTFDFKFNLLDNKIEPDFSTKGLVKYFRDIVTDIKIKEDTIDISIINNKTDHKIIIGFHTNQLSERGTEIALYDYANYNE
jgi:GR25 family glycosyltransferase involved in LPS biosynthesis